MGWPAVLGETAGLKFTVPIVPHASSAQDNAGYAAGMAFPSEETLNGIVSRLAQEFGLDVEKITVTKAGAKSKVKIAVDGDQRPDLDVLEELSQVVGDEFDAAEVRGDLDFGAGYTLELTTPGLDFPLTEPRHIQRNLGRLAVLPTGEQVRLAGVQKKDDETVVVAIIRTPAGQPGGKGKKGKRKKGQAPGKAAMRPTILVVELAEVAGVVIEVEFADMPAAQQELLNKTMAEYEALATEADEQK